jgi:competence protein ComEC
MVPDRDGVARVVERWRWMQAGAAVPALGKAVAAGFTAGVCIALWVPALPPRWLRWGLLALGVCAWLRMRRWRWPGALLAGAGWAALHAGWVLDAQLPYRLEGREIAVAGTVVSLPEVEPRRTRFRFHVDDAAGQHPFLRGRQLQLAWYDDFSATQAGPRMQLEAGARWHFTLRLRAPRGLANPGGFDAERHALAQRIAASGLVRAETARQLAASSGLQVWRERMAARIGEAVGRQSARYVQALAVGDTRGLDDADWQMLRATGLTHLIAISGFHVGMVAGFVALLAGGVWRLLPWLGRCCPRSHAAALAALCGAVGYAAVAGFALPTVRTVLMIAVVVLARLGRRPGSVAGALALAALAVLAWDPLSVLMAGFWLSFAGVAWLVWCLPGRLHWLRGFLSAQMVATVGLLPFTAMLFDQASLAGPVANLLAIPWWSLVVVPLALLGTSLEALWPGAGLWPWQASAWCFELSMAPLSWLAESRFALWWLPEARWFALPLALAGALWLLLPRGIPGKPLALLLWLPLLWPRQELPRRGEVELVLFDVGQGLSVLVRTAGHRLLYDAGPAMRDGFDAGERVVVPALHALGVGRLDALVISHGDNDHAGGAAAVVAALPVAARYAPPGMPSALAADACVTGQAWQWDGVQFEFLHPHAGFPYLRNESSCVLRVQSRHGAVLLTGDIGEVIEQGLAKRQHGQLRADVVLAPHHGSGGSSLSAFVAATRARLVLVSTGHRNRFGHPRPEVVERWQRAGAEVLVTADSGAVRVWLGAEGLQLRERRVWRRRLWDAAGRERAAAILSADEQAASAPEG